MWSSDENRQIKDVFLLRQDEISELTDKSGKFPDRQSFAYCLYFSSAGMPYSQDIFGHLPKSFLSRPVPVFSLPDKFAEIKNPK